MAASVSDAGSLAWRGWFVGRPLLIKRLLQAAAAMGTADLLGPCDQPAIARDLVMFGGLRSVDQCRIEHGLVGDFARTFVGFLDDAVDRRTVDRLDLGAVHLEHLLEALNMGFGFVEMGQKPLLNMPLCVLLRP